MGMLNQQGQKKNITLVHSSSTVSYANYLQSIITSEAKYNDFNVGIWTEKQYRDNKPTISNEDYFIFIGKSKILSEEAFGIDAKFDKYFRQYNMQYGWLGKRAFLRVEISTKYLGIIPHPIHLDDTSDPQYFNSVDDFNNFAKRYGVEPIDLDEKSINKKIAAGAVLTALCPPAGVAYTEYNALKNVKKYKELSEKINIVLIKAFYKDGISVFLNLK